MLTDAVPTRQTNILRGMALMCLGVSMFPFLNASAKYLSAEYPMPQIVWARFAGHLVFVLVAFLPRRGWRLLVTHRPGLQIGRSFFLLASTLFFVSAIGSVQLATASAIGFATPILVTALSVPLLGEPVGIRRWTAVCIGFIGVLIIVRPGSDLMNPSVLLLLGAAVSYALYQIVTRRSGAHDSAETGIVYAALVGTVVMSFIVPFVFRAPASPAHALLFSLLGILGGFGHYLVTRAFQLAPAAFISPFGYVELIGTTILGYLIFGNVPDGATWLGAAIIIAAGVYIAIRERRLAR